MDITGPILALIVAFNGATANLNGLVSDAVKEQTGQRATVMSVSGSGQDKISVRDIGRPLTEEDIAKIAAGISERSHCQLVSIRDATQLHTRTIELTCPRP